MLSLSSIGIGIYLEDLYKPQNIAANTFKEVAQTLTSYLYSNENNFLEKDVFTLEKNIKITANSEYINGLAITDPVYKEKSNFLRNLSNSNIHILMQQNKNTKKAYLEYKVSTPNSNLLNAKYLVENATLYYNIENYTKNYINDGTNNYFETLSSENTLKTNNIYLLDFITNSLKTNLKEEYFQQDTEKITIAGKEKNTNKLILILDNNLIIKLQKAILKDLKKDEKSNQILTSYIKDFANLKIDEDKKYLKRGTFFYKSLH